MKTIVILFTILSLVQVEVLAAASSCTEEFKKQYIKLQNDLRYDGKEIAYVNGKIKVLPAEVSNENTPGKEVERALYYNYQASLGKVKKIYDYLNKADVSAQDKKILENPEVTKFFKSIDPASPKKTNLDVNIETLLNKLGEVKEKAFSLGPEDKYLLHKLIVHARDRICTLEEYTKNSKLSKLRRKYLDDLKTAPLNLMIDSLRKMVGNEDIQFADQDLAIKLAVKSGIEELHKIAQNCKKSNLLAIKFNEPIQACNYRKLIDSLTMKEFQPLIPLLHFINTNQNVTNARTSLDWLDKEFNNNKPISCVLDSASKTIYVKNLPLKDNAVDPETIGCVKNDKQIKGVECLQGITIQFINGKGHSFNTKSDSGIQKLSIANAPNCANVSFTAPLKSENNEKKDDDKALCEKEPLKIWSNNQCVDKIQSEEESLEEKCKKDPQKEWKENKCINKPNNLSLTLYKCTEEQCRNGILIPDKIVEWDADKKQCVYKTLNEETSHPFCSPDSTRDPETEKTCADKKMAFREEDKSCIETQKTCEDKGLAYIESKGVCEDTQASCDKKGNAMTPKISYTLDPETHQCVEKKSDQKTAQDQTSGCKKIDPETKKCLDAADKKLSPEDQCIAENKKWLDSLSSEEAPKDRYTWDSKNKKCNDAQKKKEGAEEDRPSDEEEGNAKGANQPSPPRFQPINIPTRQMYVLPGML